MDYAKKLGASTIEIDGVSFDGASLPYLERASRRSGIRYTLVHSEDIYGWTAVGGSGWAPKQRTRLSLRTTDADALFLIPEGNRPASMIRLPWTDVWELEIFGPGSVTSNAGMIGGGFGLEGAATGIAIAAMINSLTTEHSTNTFLRVSARGGEVLLHTAAFDPGELRLRMASAYSRLADIERLGHSGESPPDPVERLERLVRLRDAGVLTEEEFERAKAKALEDLI